MNEDLKQPMAGERDPDFSDLRRWEKEVNIDGQLYVMKEASGAAARQYRAASLAGSEMAFNEDTGERTMRRMQAVASAEPVLVAACLYARKAGAGDPSKDHPVQQSLIESWPARVQKWLFGQIKEHSDLDEKDDLKAMLKAKARLEKRIAKAEAESSPEKN